MKSDLVLSRWFSCQHFIRFNMVGSRIVADYAMRSSMSVLPALFKLTQAVFDIFLDGMNFIALCLRPRAALAAEILFLRKNVSAGKKGNHFRRFAGAASFLPFGSTSRDAVKTLHQILNFSFQLDSLCGKSARRQFGISLCRRSTTQHSRTCSVSGFPGFHNRIEWSCDHNRTSDVTLFALHLTVHVRVEDGGGLSDCESISVRRI